MKAKKYIALISILSLALAGIMGGCAGCKKTPVLSSISPRSGPETGGTTITLTGKNFKEGATVIVGSNTATNVTVVSKTQITAVTPPGPVGRADVMVKNPPDVGQTSEPQTFTYTDTTPPTVISTIPVNGESPDYADPVDTKVAIGATFSEPIQEGSVTMTVSMKTLPNALTMSSGDISGVVNYNSNATIGFTPIVPLKAARKYTVSISGAKDMVGNEMNGAHTFSFELKTPKRARWYRVKEGDTLKSIADRPDTYDDENKWKTIVRVNQDLEDYMFSRDLKPGQRLLIK